MKEAPGSVQRSSQTLESLGYSKSCSPCAMKEAPGSVQRSSQTLESLAEASAGAGSGVLVALALHPLELVKTRIQTGVSKPPTTKAIAEILNNEGVMALYGGVGAQCCEEAVENFVFFYLYSALTGAAKRRLDFINTSLNLVL